MPVTLHELAHELSQPLSVIETSAYCVELLSARDPAVCAHLQRIRQQVEVASRILTKAQEAEAALNLPRTNAAMAGVTY
jgi:hypothetical protein